MRQLTALLLITFFASHSFSQNSRPLPESIKDDVAEVLKSFHVPGISLAVVKDGKVVLAQGFGVRKLGAKERVDAKTLFGIASNTKAFTAAALGMLVEEGKLGWDGKVIDVLPWFRLSDPYVTKELTIRDLLVHRSGLGLGAGDLLWWPPSKYNRREIAERLRAIPLATSFRNAYAYDNVLYLVAGEVIEAVTGLTWEEFVTRRILSPIGMRESTVRHSAAADSGNIATPHARVNGIVQVVKPFTSDNTNPAGGINASAEEIARWMIVQLDSGRIGNAGRLWSSRTTVDLWSMVVPLRAGTPPSQIAPLRANFVGYALGLEVRDYRGKKMLTHTGGLPGYLSRVTMIPELKLGIAVLTNMESGGAFNAVTYRILDHYYGAEKFDWLNGFAWMESRGEAGFEAADRAAAAARDSLSRPSLPLEKYVGTYRDPWYGDVQIRRRGEGLELVMVPTPLLIGRLEHWQYDTFVARWDDRELRADAYVTFSLKPTGAIDRVSMKPASPSVDFSYDFQDLVLTPVP